MINNDVGPFPLSFLRFRYTGTEIYDVKKWDAELWRQKIRLPNQKILRYSFLRTPSSSEELNNFDRHHDTQKKLLPVPTMILAVPMYSIIRIMIDYATLQSDTIRDLIDTGIRNRWHLAPHVYHIHIPCSDITNTNHCSMINERQCRMFYQSIVAVMCTASDSFTKYTDTVNMFTILLWVYNRVVTATIVPVSSIITRLCCMWDMTYHLQITNGTWSIFCQIEIRSAIRYRTQSIVFCTNSFADSCHPPQTATFYVDQKVSKIPVIFRKHFAA